MTNNASIRTIMCACRSLYKNVKSGNSVIGSTSPGAGMTRLGFQYHSPCPMGSGHLRQAFGDSIQCPREALENIRPIRHAARRAYPLESAPQHLDRAEVAEQEGEGGGGETC